MTKLTYADGPSSLLFCLYLVNLETTIVSTSLVSITNNLQGFDRTSWVVTGYLITYTGMSPVIKMGCMY